MEGRAFALADEMIVPDGTRQRRRYVDAYPGGGWADVGLRDETDCPFPDVAVAQAWLEP